MPVKYKVSTQRLVGVILAAGTLVQIPEIHDPLIAFSHAHPHWTGLITTAMGLLALLHNPAVCKCLGMKEQA